MTTCLSATNESGRMNRASISLLGSRTMDGHADRRRIKLLAMLAMGAMMLLVLRVLWAVAQEAPGSWSEPVRLSNRILSGWFSDIAVDDYGRAYVMWHSIRVVDDISYDLLMYSAWDGTAWSSPNDIIAVGGIGRWTMRPALSVDPYDTLHLTYRRLGDVYYAHANALVAGVAPSWKTIKCLNDTPAYYSDIAVDDQGRIHVVWNQQIIPESHRVLWFGSPDGVRRFDEYAGWEEVQWPAGPDRTVHTIFEDSAGAQWIGTADGVGRYDGATWRWFTSKDGLGSTHVYAIAEDANRMLWFGGDGGMVRYDPLLDEEKRQWETIKAVQVPVHALAFDAGGELWAGTSGGLVRYDGETWTVYSSTHGLAADAVTAIAIDSDNAVWVGSDGGLSQYDGAAWHTLTTGEGLADNHVTALVTDRNGGLWVGTEHGVSHYDGQTWASFSSANGFVDEQVAALAVDSDGVLWVGTPSRISSFDGTAWTSYGADDRGSDGPITAIAQDRILNAFCAFCADIFYRHSDDGGRTWSGPVNLSRTVAGSVKPQIKLDHSGNVHVSWEEGEDWFTGRGYPIASGYVRSLDGGLTWSKPSFFTHPADTPQQITIGIGREAELIAVWRLVKSDQVYYQRSIDSGETWSEALPIPGIVARDWDPMSLDTSDSATDSAGNVHLILVGRVGPVRRTADATIEPVSVIHLVWNGSAWSAPTPIFTSVDPAEWPRIAVGGGNKVFATWFTRDKAHIMDSERGSYQVWAASMLADAPVQTPVPVPTPTPTLAAVSVGDATPAATATPTPVVISGDSGLPPGIYTDSDEVGQLVVALSPVAVILLVIVVLRFGRFRRYG